MNVYLCVRACVVRLTCNVVGKQQETTMTTTTTKTKKNEKEKSKEQTSLLASSVNINVRNRFSSIHHFVDFVAKMIAVVSSFGKCRRRCRLLVLRVCRKEEAEREESQFRSVYFGLTSATTTWPTKNSRAL